MAYTSYEAWTSAEKFRAHPDIYNFIPRFVDHKVIEEEEKERTWRVARDAENAWRETVWFDNVQRCHFELLRAFDSDPNPYAYDERWYVSRGLLKKSVGAGQESATKASSWIGTVINSLKEGEQKLEKGIKNLVGFEKEQYHVKDIALTQKDTGKAAPYAEQKIFEKTAPMTEKKLVESTGKVDPFLNSQKHRVQDELIHQVKTVN